MKVDENFAGLISRILAHTDPLTDRPYEGKRVAELLNVSDSLITRWKKGETTPTMQTINRIPEVFPFITITEVLRSIGANLQEENPGLMDDERQVVRLYKALPAHLRPTALAVIEAMSRASGQQG